MIYLTQELKNLFSASRRNAGFTLTEVALVLVVVGLVIGGVLKGRELIHNARITATITEIKSIQTAVKSFRDTYSALPGDMRNASTRLPNCDNAICNGDGNGAIGNNNWSEPHERLMMLTPQAEMTRAWLHLQQAGFIKNIENTIALDLAPAYGATNMAAAIPNTGYRLATHVLARFSGLVDDTWIHPRGIVLVLGGSSLRLDRDLDEIVPPAPWMLARIDRRIDDGKPETGAIIVSGRVSIDGSPGCYIQTNVSGGIILYDYAETVNQGNCSLVIALDRRLGKD